MTRKRARSAALVLATLAIFATGCGDDGDSGGSSTQAGGSSTTASSTTTAAPRSGGSITMGMYSETAGLDPVVTNGGGTTGQTELTAVFDTLMRYNTESKAYEPHLAQALSSNADLTEWTLKLRPDVKFTDGTALDAEAVVYGMKRHTQFGSRAAAQVAIIKEYTVVDPLTVRFTLSAPWANFPYTLAYTPGMVPSPTAVKAACGANHETAPRNCNFNLQPVGAGPFKVQRYVPKESITVVRNDTYWNGKPYLDQITFKVLAGAPATFDALSTGTLQIGFLREAEVVKKATDEKKLDTYTNLQWAGGVALLNNGKVNCRKGLPAAICKDKPDGVIEVATATSDVRIRQAIGYALDPNAINQRANGGAGFPGGELFQKSSKWASSAPLNTFDLAKARALVDEVKKEGKWDGTIRLNCHNAPSRQSWATTFQTLLTSAGFNVKLKNDYDIAALVADVQNTKQYDIACWGLNIAEEAPEIALLLGLLSTSAANSLNYANPDMDAQIQIVRSGKTEAERKAAMEKVQEIWRKDMPVPVYEALVEMIAWNKNLKGVRPTLASVVMFDKAWLAG